MNGYEVIECLAKAFSQNQLYALRKNLADDCVYSSQYAKASVSGADNIIERLGTVYSNLKEGDEYTYEIIDLKSILQEGVSPQDLCVNQAIYACEYAILMYQFTDKKLVAVTWCTLDDNGKINGIFLSMDKSKFNLHFHGEKLEIDDPYDLPDTVTPLSENVIKSNRGYSDFFDIRINNTSVEDGKFYIWRKADEFMKEWLPCRGYSIIKSTIFTDCIGYRCKRKGTNYTVYLYAYGNKETTAVNAETCKKLRKLTFSDDSIILVVYVNVERYMLADTVAYKIRNYCGEEEYEPDFWQLTEIQGRRIAVSFIGAELTEPICIPALVYYPRKEIMDLTLQFMYAFNREDCDVYDCILEDEPSIKGKIGPGEYSGYIKGEAFYNVLRNIHIQYGDMMLGYVRYDDATYSAVPYVDGYGYFGWTVYGNNRLDNFIFHKFQDCEYRDFIKTDKREADDLFDYVPKLISARPLPPVESERFAVLLQFDNGECKKYVLPIYNREAKQEAVSCRQHIFSDGIWQSADVNCVVKGLLDMQERKIQQNSILTCLLREKKQTETSIENMLNAIERGVITNSTTKRLKELENKLNELERKILIEKSKETIKLTEKEIKQFYEQALRLEPQMLINYLVKEIILFDDRMEIIFNNPLKYSPDEDQGFTFCSLKVQMPYIAENNNVIRYRDFYVTISI